MSNKVDANPDGGDDEDNTGKHPDADNTGPGDDQRDTGKHPDADNTGPGDDQRDTGKHRDARPGGTRREPGNTRGSDSQGSDAGRLRAGRLRAGRLRAGYVVDRIEAGYAVLIAEDGGATVDEPVGHLPKDAREGSCLLRREDGSFIVDQARTAERRAQARDRLKALRGRSRRNR